MRVICHVGPERSWSELSAFLKDAENELVSSIYQFHAKHIADLLGDELGDNTSLNLIMDRKSRDPGNDVIKDGDFDRSERFNTWKDDYGDKFSRIYVPLGRRGLVRNSYHIKVTVKDDESFWLSSGNWKRSSQPLIPDDKLDDLSFVNRSGNREWHIIAANAELSKRFKNHILADIKHSKELGGREEAPFEPPVYVDVPEEEFALESIELESFRPSQLLEPMEINRKVVVKPLMTPDIEGAVYCESVIELIESARHQLLFQIPYINTSISKASSGYAKRLMDALVRKSEELDDFRLLLRAYTDRDKAVALKRRGIDFNRQVRQVRNHHTKGMIVDGQRVLVGSHNWSRDGVTLNRDASLLFNDQEIAEFYKQAFEIDWHRGKKVRIRSRSREGVARVATTEAPPQGFRRILLEDYLED